MPVGLPAPVTIATRPRRSNGLTINGPFADSGSNRMPARRDATLCTHGLAGGAGDHHGVSLQRGGNCLRLHGDELDRGCAAPLLSLYDSDDICCSCYGVFVEVGQWRVRLSDEVRDWYLDLAEKDRATTDRVIAMLEQFGPQLRMPHSRSLGEDLYELRFSCHQVARRITYTFEPKRQIITLTTFRKQRDNERREVARARNVLRRRRRGTEDTPVPRRREK